MKHFLIACGWVGFCLMMMLACSSGSSSATPEDVLAVSVGQVGSIVGTPVVPTKNTIILQATDEAAPADTDASALPGTCTPYVILNTDGTIRYDTQICDVKKADYTMGILAIYLIACADAGGVETACLPYKTSSIASRVTLYQGEQVDVVIGEQPATFPADIADLMESVGFRAGGLQIVTSYIGHIFPDEASYPAAAEKIVPYLRGKAYRICTTPHAGMDNKSMATRCGNPEAEQGDFLVDLDGDGFYGFLDLNFVTPDAAEETAVRPADYSRLRQKYLKILFAEDAFGDLTVTDGNFYPSASYLAQIVPFSGIDEIQSDETRSFFVHLFTSGTLRFMDGARSMLEKEPVCVDAAVEQKGRECLINSDPHTPGVYNPYYDLYPRIKLPKPAVRFSVPQ